MADPKGLGSPGCERCVELQALVNELTEKLAREKVKQRVFEEMSDKLEAYRDGFGFERSGKK